MKIMRNVADGQCGNSLMRIQIRYTAIFLGTGWLPKEWSGLQFGMFAPAHNPKIGYKCIAFYACFLPGLPGSVCNWPIWYRTLRRLFRFRIVILPNFV